MSTTKNAIERAQKDANHYWDRVYAKFLETGDSSQLAAAMNQCNINDQAHLLWVKREREINILRNTEKMSDEEWNQIETRRKVLLQMVNEIIEKGKKRDPKAYKKKD